MLYIVTGQPAVGKSTWAEHLAKKKRACLIDIDTMFEPVVQAGLSLGGLNPDDRDSEKYKATFRAPIYEAMFRAASSNLHHVPVILCAPFTRELSDPEWTQKIMQRVNCDVVVYWLYAPVGQLKKQMLLRGNPRDKMKLANWEQYQMYFTNDEPRCEHIPIDMGEKKNGS